MDQVKVVDVISGGLSNWGLRLIANGPYTAFELLRSRLEAMIADQEEQLRQVNPLQRAYMRSEERCKQLVEVTQQWSIECEEKLKVIKMLEKEAEQLKAQIQQLEGRVTKYKKYWMDTKDMQMGRVSDVQFEELRSELASRRQLYDQVSFRDLIIIMTC